MPSFTETAIKLYRRLFGSPAMAGQLPDGIETVLDGNTAVAITEACIADSAALGSGFPGGDAEIVWHSEQQRNGSNMFGGLLHSHEAESPRGALAAAMGLALAGQRATLFLDSQDLAAAQDLLVSSAGRHLPLVLHLNNRALAGAGAAPGSGHEALHMSADSGCFTLFAANVQQAVDFTLIARRVAELALIPGIVAMDGEQTAGAGQEVKLPSRALVSEYLGGSNAAIPAVGEAQRLLFGETRRRVPRWHDLDRPVLTGALQDARSYALGTAAQAPFFDRELPALLEQALNEFARLTGRRYSPVTCHNAEKARLLLVAQGSAIETAIAVADHLRQREKIKIGVVGLHSLRPLPGATLARLLAGKQAVAVLERLDTPLAGDLPLMRELRSALEHAMENGRYGSELHPDYPALQEPERPRMVSVIYGLGGLPLRAADLVALGRSLNRESPARHYLGLDFHRRDSLHPKRQALLDTLRRHYPGIEKLALHAAGVAPDLRPAGSLTLAIHHPGGQPGKTLALETGSFLHQLLGGQLRSRPAIGWHRQGAPLLERLVHAAQGLRDPGDDLPLDIVLITGSTSQTGLQPLPRLSDEAIVILDGSANETAPAPLPAQWREQLRSKGIRLYNAPPASEGERPPEQAERLIGALFGALLASERLALTPRRLRSARKEALGHLGEAERNRRLEAFGLGLESVRLIETLPADETAPVRRDGQAPLAVRHLGSNEARYDSLPRFWDQVGVLYKNGEAEQLTADPYLATGVIPPLSASFNDHSASLERLPRLHPANCSACGACWRVCPDSAIGATALSPRALVETGIALASAGEVRAIAGKLATGIATLCRRGESEAGSADQLLGEAYAWLQERSPLPEERREATAAAIERMQEALSGLPVSITEALFHQAEKARKESGELLVLSINPDSCKGCGLCSAACPDEALSMESPGETAIAQARRLWLCWQQTPDTPSATIERLTRDGAMDPLAALMLSRHCAFALSGGDTAEAGSGEKIALRQILAATEYQQQPLLHRFIQELGSAQAALSAKIRDTLADALPTEDLDQLAATLQQLHTREAALGTILRQDEEKLLEGSGIDTQRMRRLIDLTRNIGELHWRLSKGEHGLGRARYGLAFARGSAATWAGAFPNNPFEAPVTLDMNGDAPQLAAGLLHGQLNETLEAIRLLRQARAELDPKSADGLSMPTGWKMLSDEERRLVAPLILVGNDRSLGGEGFAQLAWLLNSELPVKIVVLADLDFGLDNRGIEDAPSGRQADARSDLALMALAQRNAYVAQSSIAAPEHLRESVRGMLRFAGPALLRIHAPSPGRHGFAPTAVLQQARLALHSRALPLFRYDPQGEGVFGSRLTLDGNPEPLSDWVREGSELPVTPAHWALHERRFTPRLAPLQKDAAAPTELLAWLALDEEKRRGKTPYITGLDESGGDLRYAVDSELALLVERLAHLWRTLQELGGLVTPFTARVEAEVRESLAAAHQAELDALRKEYEAKLRALEEGMHGQMHRQITRRLMELAGYEN